VNKPNPNICVTLPCPPGYSETFLRAHVDNLSAAVNYLQDFPIDIEDALPKQTCFSRADELKRKVRVCWHRYALNPVKKHSLRTFFKRNNINIVLAEYGLTGIRVFSVCKELNIPLVVHFHGYDAYLTELLNRHRQTYKRMFNYASAVIAVSKHMREQLIILGAPSDKVFYSPYGVDTDKFKLAPVPTSRLQVISVGRFVEKKAPYLTIVAFKKVLDRLPEARLVMVGTGLLYDICCKLIKALHLEHAVDLKGVLDHDEVAALMQQSRVFVQHSVVTASGDTEGTPVAILEAGAAGLPVVSTRHAGITDVVLHGKTGFLVDEGDIDSMSEYLYKFLSDPELARDMGHNARDYIDAKFSTERSIENLKNILKRCVNPDIGVSCEVTSNQTTSLAVKKKEQKLSV
jgi:colanic acid/amylovoran biosynthesis glycosyltransferase